MTSRDENHITRTTPGRMGKGLLVILIPVAITVFFTITMWHYTSSFPPPVSSPKPAATPVEGGRCCSASGKTWYFIYTIGGFNSGKSIISPEKITAKKGDIITVTNNDNAPHTATNGATPEDPQTAKLFDTSLIMPGKSAQIKTAELGTW